MARKLPPLNTLRAFEASCRYLSFTKAAEELFVTQAAISHQIKTLEEALDVKLFRRLNRALLLTEEGQVLLPAVRESLSILGNAVAKLREQERSGTLTVSMLPSFASSWMVPRLGRFQTAHPDIDLRISANFDMVDFDRDDVDVAIRFGKGRYPGLASVHFRTEDIFPVCSPGLLNDPDRPLSCPEDLKYHTLLHDDMETDWRMWLMAAGVKGVDASRGTSLNQSDMVLQAAIDGQGVALGRSILAQRALRSGQLVKPFDLTLPSDYAYYFVCPEAAFDRPKTKAFREWLFSEAETS
ncbi:transcriptional regulator GcvA [Aestuariispira insulae]|uniref:LysR family transcriptional regulator n=1 Tax=Aestuariispira insulae TaxID=1461337 RepID=A0A3D9HHX6_9PROT|nr:transcriptional regulator GcvA [Aestuariispira insulae]RED49119.1 LysR family transcriptional regulator [Aestuariispira insulae]